MNTQKDNINVGDTIFSLNGDKITEWEIIARNPNNNRFFIVINKETDNVKEVHWKTLEYGGDNVEYFSLSKTDLIKRYQQRTTYVIAEISKLG